MLGSVMVTGGTASPNYAAFLPKFNLSGFAHSAPTFQNMHPILLLLFPGLLLVLWIPFRNSLSQRPSDSQRLD